VCWPAGGPLNGQAWEAQRRLAEITEMIHTASLFHDDVIDEADARRGVPSVNKLHGNKMAVLAGDFLLARASVSLARLRNVEVVELLSTVIEHLVKGEVSFTGHHRAAATCPLHTTEQSMGTGLTRRDHPPTEQVMQSRPLVDDPRSALEYYLHKNYYKTGSLMSNSCRAALMLAGHTEELQALAFAYGRHVGLAFQVGRPAGC
jgi:geranylgeranyl pyrophosphate synthase